METLVAKNIQLVAVRLRSQTDTMFRVFRHLYASACDAASAPGAMEIVDMKHAIEGAVVMDPGALRAWRCYLTGAL